MKKPNRLAVWYVLATPVLAGISTVDFHIGSFNYTGYLWAALIPIGLLLLAVNRLSGADPGGIMPCWPWLLWCGYVFTSLLFCEELGRRNVQEAFQLCMPIVVGLVAASAIRTQAQLRQLTAAFGVGLLFLAVYTAAYVTERYDMEWMSIHLRSATLTVMLIGIVFLAAFPRRKILPLAVWGVCIAITAVTSSRMATGGLMMAPLIHPLFRHKFWKLTAAVGIGALGLTLFYTETFQEHFFDGGKGTLSEVFSGDMADFGRWDTWVHIWDRSWERPLFGYGVGTAFDYIPQIWLDTNHIHNDYLRIFFELGLVGLALFAMAMTWQLVTLRRQISLAESSHVRETFAAAWMGFCAMLLTCATDNTLIYHVYYNNPLFVLVGAAYGVAWAERQATSPGSTAITVRVPVTAWSSRLKELDRAAIGVGPTGGMPQQGLG
jgi:O-antigen ligase